jgi:hypothetical protein
MIETLRKARRQLAAEIDNIERDRIAAYLATGELPPLPLHIRDRVMAFDAAYLALGEAIDVSGPQSL